MKFIFRNQSSDEFGIKIISCNYLSSSARNVEVIPIDGRDGDLLIDYGNYKNFKLKFEIEIDAQDSSLEKVCYRIKKWLQSGFNYSELRLYRDDILIKVYQATFISNLDITETYKNFGTCLLQFECRPNEVVI